MSESGGTTGGTAVAWVALTPRERRVVGVMVEKAKTTPENYPMSVAAIVTGSNQKSNRDPVTNYDIEDVEDTLDNLRKKGAAIKIEGGGRVPKWKHTLYDWLKVNKVELAVVGELLLRGPQTEGDLRARASRMEPLADLAAVQLILDALSPRGLVHYLSPPGQRRGVFVTHGLYPAEEMEKVRVAFAGRQAPEDEAPTRLSTARTGLDAAAAAPGWVAEVASIRIELEAMRAKLDSQGDEIRDLKTQLGV